MNKMMTSLVGIGAGMAAMAMMNCNDMRTPRPLRKMAKQVRNML